MIFDDLYNNIISLQENLPNILVEVMMDSKEEIIDLNVEQVEHGINIEGGMLGEYASDEYASFKQSIGSQAPIGIVDLKLTGDFLEGFYAEPYFGSNAESSGLFIDSKDDKTGKLERWYHGIFGITEENAPKLFELLIDQTQKTIQDVLTK